MLRVRKIKGQDGFISVGIAITMAFLGVMAVGASTMMNTSTRSNADQMNVQRAESNALAGHETALKLLSEGQNPAGVYPMPVGSFEISASYPRVTITGRAGDAEVTHSLDTSFAGDCMVMTCEGLQSVGRELRGLQFNKSCLNTPVVSSLRVEIEEPADELITGVTVAGQEVFKAWPGQAPGMAMDIEDVATLANPVLSTPVDAIEFAAELPANKTYSFFAEFADGTTASVTCEDTNGQVIDETPGYSVNYGEIDIDDGYTVEFEVLCADMTDENNNEASLRSRLTREGFVDENWLFGPDPLQGGEIYAESNQNGIPITYVVGGNAELGDFNFSVQSNDTSQVRTFTNGVYPGPFWQDFGGTAPVESCVSPYFNTTTQHIQLPLNQLLMMFEFEINYATDDWAPPPSGYQNLVLLITVEEDAAQ